MITVPNTFMATAEAITYCGARPVFVDVDERTYTMDPAALEKALRPGQRRSSRFTFLVSRQTWIRSWNSRVSTVCL